MYRRIKHTCLRAIGIAVLGFLAVLVASATPSSAASYTLNYTGTVTSTTGFFAASFFLAGDPVTGSLTFGSFNETPDASLPNQYTFTQGCCGGEPFHVTGIFSDYSVNLPSNGGSVISDTSVNPALTLDAFNGSADVSLRFQTDGATPVLTSLAGLPTTSDGILALLGGNPLLAEGT